MKNTLLLTYSTNILVPFLTVNMKNCLTPKNTKMCQPILVTLLKMRAHYSQSGLENTTPSSGTLASYKEVPPASPHYSITPLLQRGFSLMLILPRSVVDEAKSEIWSINQIQFSFFISHSNCQGIVGEWHEYCYERALWCLQLIRHKIFFWSFPLLLASLRCTNTCIDHDRLCTSQGPLKNKRMEKLPL